MSKARILLVEDEGIIAEDLQTSLEEMGYEIVSVAASGEAAIERAEATHPDLVLMDVVLQGEMDGIEAANRIHISLNIPVIYLTAYADDKMLERAKITAPFGYLIKPIRDRELYTNIEMTLFRHELENRLRESQAWLSVTLSSIGDAVVAVDKEGLVRFMNPVAESLSGWSQTEAEGRPLTEVFHALDEKTGTRCLDIQIDPLDNRESRNLSDRCNLLVAKDGRGIAVDTGAAHIRDQTGDVIGMVLVFRDVTEKKDSEERLRLLSEAVEQTTEGIAVVDVQGNLLFLNQAFAAMHGYTSEELNGEHLSAFHDEEQMPSVNAANAEILETGEFSGEIWHLHRDGSVFPGLMHNSLLRDQDGKPVGMIGTLRDITDLKQAEEALRQSHEKLEAKVKERTIDLENSRKELKKYSESLEKTNEALKIIIEGIEEQKKEVEKRIAHNVNLTVKPIIDQLKTQDLPDTIRFLLQSLEFNLSNIFSSFGLRVMKEGLRLTPREVRICEMIRSGLTSKQMGKVMGISPQTVLVHRKNIRKKLGLAKTRQNLASYLKANL